MRCVSGLPCGHDTCGMSILRVVCLAAFGRQLVVLAVAARWVLRVAADEHGAEGWQAGGDDGDGGFDHGDGAGQHGFVEVGVVGSDDCT